MKRLSLKEAFAIATIHDALREFRFRGRHAQVSMMSDEITIHDYADTVNEIKTLKKLLCFFKDDDDTIEVRKYEATADCPEFWVVKLRKRLV